ncbi:hypothetical protein [Nocardioides sp.]|uniref:hypothetical protein n=1 Tax=Nocardioides sp. TaxID=35761 RepID=UPI002B92061D|nr:hypothetical protein [Nocardioides sp.]HXH80968.1 hypothetical protein [Nocardioides sp.]
MTWLLSGCSMFGIGGTPNAAVGETVEVPAGLGETDGKVAATLKSLERAPEKVTKQFEGDAEIWFAEMTFDHDQTKLAKYDWTAPWVQVYGYLSDGSVVSTSFLGGDMTGCEEDEVDKLMSDYAAGKEIEVCVSVSGDDSAEFAGVYFGDASTPNSSAVWEK